MPVLVIQNLKINKETGKIISGSASIKESRYIPKSEWVTPSDPSKKPYHSKSVTREGLGRVLFLAEDRKSGIFQSPTRGIIHYDVLKDEFSEVSKTDERISHLTGELFPDPPIHTVFGDVYLFLHFLQSSGLQGILRTAFPDGDTYERLLMHTIHGILKDGSHIHCDSFIRKSFASYLIKDVPLSSLACDTKFYTAMGSDEARLAFFREFVTYMKSKDPSFGKGCFVDSTPLPNDIENNPFNALCSHGVTNTSVQTRLVLILDEGTGLPVWYEVIPGNVLDLSTIMNIAENVYTSIGITIESMTLDAGYVTKELIMSLSLFDEDGNEKKAVTEDEEEAKKNVQKIIARMPAKKGYPYRELYEKNKRNIENHKNDILREGHSYFGKREEIELFGTKIYAYIYLDRLTAQVRYIEYLKKHEDDFEKMTAKEKNWQAVKNGYFVLLSNKERTPKELLTEYFERTQIESVFKTSKEYLQLLPLSKWSETTVRGKILHDIIDTIILLQLRKQLHGSGRSTTELFGTSQSWMCFYSERIDEVVAETPNAQVKELCKLLGIKKIPSSIPKFRNYIDRIYKVK